MKKLMNELNYIKIRNNVYLELEEIVMRNGYIKVEPDYFEDYDWFTKVNKRIDPKSMVKLFDKKGNVLLLRPDITTNIIKQISPVWEKESIIKIFYNTTTFRQLNQEIVQTRQFGIEYIGNSTISSEIELIQIIATMFRRFSPNFMLSIGNQKLLDELLSNFSVASQKELKKAISKRDVPTYLELTKNSTNTLIRELLTLKGSIPFVLEQLNKMNTSDLVIKYIEFINEIKESLDDNVLQFIDIDLALINEFDYYCGMVLQGYLKTMSRPLLYGGRYDKLTSQYGNEIPAVGISFDVGQYLKEVQNG